MSKTTLKQKKDLVEAIQKEPKLVSAIVLLRDWLAENGYEDAKDCKHYAVIRTTGKCMNCPTIVMEPIITDSDEALEALRKRLRGE